MSEADDILRGMRICGPPATLAPSGFADDVVERAPSALDAAVAQARRLVALLQRAISFPAMLGMLLVGAVFGVVRSFNVDPDLWWHIKTGELILSTHRWATTDPYSYTAKGMPWMSCEWLGDLVFAAVYRVEGLRGLEALLVLLASGVILTLYAFATLRSGNSKAGFVAAAVLLTLANGSFNLRPQMMGYLFLILTLIVLERFRQ